MPEPLVLVSTLAAGMAGATLTWWVSLRLRDAAIVDVFWAFGFALIALVCAGLRAPDVDVRGLLLVGLALVWSARLGAHMVARRRGRPEDFRYAAMRAYHGEQFGRRSLVRVFLLQAVIQWVISLPLQLPLLWPGPTSLGALDYLGLTLFVIGLAIEATADWQLERFRADPAQHGRVLQTGLWRYSRHPNYLGEAVLWWGIGLCASASAAGWLCLVSPALLTFLLLRVSGVPLLEQGLRERLPGYAAYAERTPALLPWPRALRRTNSSQPAQ
jgi:steroid 5-alpha reductase family enzyme